MTRTEIADRFIAGETIEYRRLDVAHGKVFSRYDRRCGEIVYRLDTDAEWTREKQDEYLAHYRVPSDAQMAA